MTEDLVKFLLVDDTEENLVALEALLRRDGLELLKARTGAEALELLLVHDVALALLDVQMPEMNGFELAELMRGMERTKHVPIIFLTAGTRDRQRLFKGYEAGAVDFLFKPLEPHILKSKTDVFFELYRQKLDITRNLRMNEMFVGILGHDLRAPLSSLTTGVELLDRQLTNEAQRRVLRRMSSSASRMKDMIEQLMDLTRARLAQGMGFMQNRSRVDVRELINRVADELRVTAPDRVVSVTALQESETVGDSTRLLQLFSNLISNAIRHGAPGTPIEIIVESSVHEVVVVVRNQGTIPASILPQIFDPFRGARTTHGTQGLGLGLFISQQIVAAHGGAITVQSSPEVGTAFTVRLPKTLVVDRPRADPRSKKLLVVDDDENIRESLRQVFEDEGYDVDSASNGQEALDLLAGGSSLPDVVILDLVMPVLDGAGVYEIMQSDPRLSQIPIIVSTSTPAKAPPGARVVPKPVNLDPLVAMVAELSTRGPRP